MQTQSKGTLAASICVAIAFVGVVVPIILGILIGITPDALTHRAEVGQFVSANASAGGFMTMGVTTIQTTDGSLIVDGRLSANRGQALEVRQTLKHAPRLCIDGPRLTCADLAGPWAGPMPPVPHPHYRFAPLVVDLGADGVAIWLLFGLAATIISAAIVAIVTNPDEPEDRKQNKACE
ncbi:MAG: hypothetical protein ACREPL_13845 [Rhodanobacteraceae bacterium]